MQGNLVDKVSKLTFQALALRQSEFLSRSIIRQNELPVIGSLRVAMFTPWRPQKSMCKHKDPSTSNSFITLLPQFLQKLTPFIHHYICNQVCFSNVARCQFSGLFCLSRLIHIILGVTRIVFSHKLAVCVTGDRTFIRNGALNSTTGYFPNRSKYSRVQ